MAVRNGGLERMRLWAGGCAVDAGNAEARRLLRVGWERYERDWSGDGIFRMHRCAAGVLFSRMAEMKACQGIGGHAEHLGVR